jgi:alkanesulfonate monooxygenase SsuD/methylene tetrahydromethanopterin reductase-like flavin-dependent oxidoreductase (luciferase family)
LDADILRTRLRFGIGHFTLQRPPGDTRTFHERYTDLLSLAREVEDAGLDSLWLTEHHFAADGYLAAQLPVAAAILGATERIVVSPGLLLPLYHPLRLAEDLAALDLMSGGRLVVGIGAGYRREEYAGLGVQFEEAKSRLEETLDILELAATGEPFDHRGPAFQFTGVRVLPPPATRGGFRFVMTGGSEDAARRAARRKAMFMCDPAQSWDEVSRLVALYDALATEPGLDLPVFCYGFISEIDPWAAIRDGFLHLRRTYDAWMGKSAAVSENPSSHRLMMGGRAEVVNQLVACRQRFGDRTHIVLRLDYPGMDRSTVSQAISAYGEVAATVRSLTP